VQSSGGSQVVGYRARGTAWLESHRLPGAGLGGYWQASVVTLTSGGTVAIRPIADDGGGIGQHPGEVDDAWFDPRRSVARFVVLSPGEPEYPATPTTGRFAPPGGRLPASTASVSTRSGTGRSRTCSAASAKAVIHRRQQIA
jgi:hypothetical protein